jgi:ketosteroid isomerase-like protein
VYIHGPDRAGSRRRALVSADEKKAIVRRFMEAYNNRQLDIFDELVAEDYITTPSNSEVAST